MNPTLTGIREQELACTHSATTRDIPHNYEHRYDFPDLGNPIKYRQHPP